MTASHQKVIAAVTTALLGAALLAGCTKPATAELQLWGRAEAKEMDINTKVPGRVAEILVKEGQEVKKGQLLARIDSKDLVAKAEQARAQIQSAEAQVSQSGTVTALQDRTLQAAVEAAEAQVAKAKADLALNQKDLERYKSLREAGAIGQQVLDGMETKYEVAASSYNQSLANLEATRAALLQGQVNRDNQVATEGKMAQAQAALQEVQVYLDETELRSPIDGIVTTLIVEQGELVSTGMPLMTLQNPKDNWVNIKVKETELQKYTLNQTVQLRGRNENVLVQGTIVDIGKKPEFATYRATNERGDTDIITFNVKIQTNSDQIRPGMRFQLIDGGR